MLFGLYHSNNKLFWIITNLILFFSVIWVGERQSDLTVTHILKFILNYENIAFVFLVLYLSFFSNYQQSKLFWVTTKLTIVLVAFILFLSSVVFFFRGGDEWIIFFFFAIVWVPSIEFIPSLIKYQKGISVSRLMITFLILMFFPL